MSVVTRFAPSPTGYLHIGGVRTALFSWLYARQHGGQFILRIEDTDRERSTEQSVQAIIDGMQWLGLNYDQKLYFQSEHFQRYQQCVEQLLAEGKAYHCHCSKERLEQLREQQLAAKQKPKYDGHCREQNLAAKPGSSVIRFKNPSTGQVSFDDEVYGTISVNNEELDDFVLYRADGTPTYNFSVVIDDWDMNISHVIRGDDHINNTPRQINLLNALDAQLPKYAHLPMILGDDGKRLSKRHGAVSVLNYQQQGFVPEAMLNYLARLGWSHQDQEIFSRDELIRHFNLAAVNRSPASFDRQKLLWINQHYLKTLPVEQLLEPLLWQYQQLGILAINPEQIAQLLPAFVDRAKTLKELAEKSRYVFEPVADYDPDAVAQHITDNNLPVVSGFVVQLEQLSDWSVDNLKTALKQQVKQAGIKFPQLAQPIRIALTGSTESPSIDQLMVILGKKETLTRLTHALQQWGGSQQQCHA